MRTDLAILLTARSASQRLPNKALAEVNGRSMINWIIYRLKTIGQVALVTTNDPSDDGLASFVRAMGFPVCRGSTTDVVGSMDKALHDFFPNARYVMRGMGDCPFIAHEMVERACTVMDRTRSEAFVWALPPWIWPVYGAREFPYSRSGWDKIVHGAKGDQLEHSDAFFHANRSAFSITYHEPPKNIYLRPYRLEVDWPEDLAMVKYLAKYVSMLSPLETIIQTLDTHEEIAIVNRQRVEKTGPTTYPRAVQRAWAKNMQGQPIVLWDDSVIALPEKGEPIFCDGGSCMLGYSSDGVLMTVAGHAIIGEARMACECGAGRHWCAKKRRGRDE